MSLFFTKLGGHIVMSKMEIRVTTNHTEFFVPLDWKVRIIGNKLILSGTPTPSVLQSALGCQKLESRSYGSINSTLIVDRHGKVYYFEKSAQHNLEMFQYVDITDIPQFMVSSHPTASEAYNWLTKLGHSHDEIIPALSEVWVENFTETVQVPIAEIAAHLSTLTGTGPEFEDISRSKILCGKKALIFQ